VTEMHIFLSELRTEVQWRT